MLYTKDHKTLDMFDPLDRFGPERRKLLERSWAKGFRDDILPELPVELLSNRYYEFMGLLGKLFVFKEQYWSDLGICQKNAC